MIMVNAIPTTIVAYLFTDHLTDRPQAVAGRTLLLTIHSCPEGGSMKSKFNFLLIWKWIGRSYSIWTPMC